MPNGLVSSMRRISGGVCLLSAVLGLGCSQAHQHEIDTRLEKRFHFAAPRDTNVDDVLRTTILRSLPPGAPTDSIYGYLNRHGFGRAGPSGPTPEPAYYRPLDASGRIEARLEDYREWNSPFDVVDIGVHIEFDVNSYGRLVDVLVERRGSGL